VQEAGAGADDAPARSPLFAHASESDPMKPAMRAARASAYLRRERWIWRGYRNSPEMRLTEPATMTTPNT
jgi:hypothetical protein